MQNPPAPAGRDDSSLPHVIRSALDRIPYLPLKSILRDALYRVARCACASDPARRFRLSVEYLMRELDCSRSTAKRRLRELRRLGWIGRWQSTRGARRHGWRPAWTWLTEQALDALGLVLQRGPQLARTPNPVSQGNRWTRLRRIPADLSNLAERIGERRVAWLMSECRKAGRRLQDLAAAALQADSPAGFVLRALRGVPVSRESNSLCSGGVNVGQSTPARAVCAGREEQRAAALLGGAARARMEQWRALRR